MKQILLTISSLFLLVGCSTYTVKVEVDGVKVNGKDVKNGECVEYSDSFFGLLGDFPLTVQVGDGEEDEHEANNYVVNAEGAKKADEACEEEEEAEEAEEAEEEEEEEEEETPTVTPEGTPTS